MNDCSYFQIDRRSVESYWHMSLEQRKSAKKFAPYKIFTIKRSSGSAGCTSFTITLNGSKSRLEIAEPISFLVLCKSPILQPPTSHKRFSIKFVQAMYTSDSPVLEGLTGHKNPSLVSMRMDNVHCCILLCEISFHLFLWKELGEYLGLEEDCIESLKYQYGNVKYVPAFEMLKQWVSDSSPDLGMLIEKLNTLGYSLDLSQWTTSYDTVRPKPMDRNFLIKLAQKIKYYWMFIARILGEPEGFIDTIISDYKNNIYEQAYQMLWQWKRHCAFQEGETYLRLFNSIHCMYEHTRVDSLNTALSWLE